MTDFAQAILRFRNINRETYLSIIIIDDTDEKSEYGIERLHNMLISMSINLTLHKKRD